MPQRTGDCEWCGQCCGADGSPNQISPWPKAWPEALETWEADVLPSIVKMAGDPLHGGPSYYQVKIGGIMFYAIWVPGHGLCKDLPPYGDNTSYSLECPFLKPDLHCGLAVAAPPIRDSAWAMCRNELVAGYIPENDVWTDTQRIRWQTDHPLCTYTFLEVSSPSSSPSPSEEP